VPGGQRWWSAGRRSRSSGCQQDGPTWSSMPGVVVAAANRQRSASIPRGWQGWWRAPARLAVGAGRACPWSSAPGPPEGRRRRRTAAREGSRRRQP
jgi:hypothetical protein